MKIKQNVYEALIRHAKRELPIEACGYLASVDDVVIKHYELVNIDNSSEHFSFEPAEQFKVVKDARANGYDLCAVYHSHPQTPARPSDEDIKLAYDSSISYVIVSLADGQEDIKSFKN